MIGLLASLTKLVIILIFTFFFVVLFQHGPANFIPGVSTEWNSFTEFVTVKVDGFRHESGPAAPPAPTPAP